MPVFFFHRCLLSANLTCVRWGDLSRGMQRKKKANGPHKTNQFLEMLFQQTNQFLEMLAHFANYPDQIQEPSSVAVRHRGGRERRASKGVQIYWRIQR